MPFYQRRWNTVLDEVERPKPTGKTMRTVPIGDVAQSGSNFASGTKSAGTQSSIGGSAITSEIPSNQPADSGITSTAGVPAESNSLREIDKRKARYTRQMLRRQVDELQATQGAVWIKADDSFLNFKIKRDFPIFVGKYSSIYPCTNAEICDPETTLIVRIYQPNSGVITGGPGQDCDNLFLKILRHIGRKHPCIVATFAIYNDCDRMVYVFQEFCIRGNVYDYVKAGNVVAERTLCKWSQSIYHALDYLGDVGVAHRSIQPKHLLLKSIDADGSNGELIAKLTSFRDAIIYWDPATNDIIDQPCKPVAKRVYLGFQAPEIFGEPHEHYNPIEADVWSFGATMFYIGSRMYPFNLQQPEPNLDAAIQENIERSKLSLACKAWFAGLLRADSRCRTEFDSIPTDPWFKSN